jgi:hypothetical protein
MATFLNTPADMTPEVLTTDSEFVIRHCTREQAQALATQYGMQTLPCFGSTGHRLWSKAKVRVFNSPGRPADDETTRLIALDVGQDLTLPLGQRSVQVLRNKATRISRKTARTYRTSSVCPEGFVVITRTA